MTRIVSLSRKQEKKRDNLGKFQSFTPAFSNYFTPVNKRHKDNTRLASRSSYTLPVITTNYGKFSVLNLKVQSEEIKSLHRFAFKKTLKKEIIQSY